MSVLFVLILNLLYLLMIIFALFVGMSDYFEQKISLTGHHSIRSDALYMSILNHNIDIKHQNNE